MHFLILLIFWPLANYWTEFHRSFSVDALWDKDERVNAWGQKVKGQGHNMTKGPARRTGVLL